VQEHGFKDMAIAETMIIFLKFGRGSTLTQTFEASAAYVDLVSAISIQPVHIVFISLIPWH